MIGVQYDTATGEITGTCRPPIPDSQALPDGRAQLVVAEDTDLTNKQVVNGALIEVV